MFTFAEFVIRFISLVFDFFTFTIIISALLSWFPGLRNGRVRRFCARVNEPLVRPVRRLIDRSPFGGPGMMIDFSPMIVLLILQTVKTVVVSFLYNLFFSI